MVEESGCSCPVKPRTILLNCLLSTHRPRQHAPPGDLPHGGAPQEKLYDKNLLPADMRDEQQRAQHWAEAHGHSHKKVHAQPQHVLEEQQHIAGQGGRAAPRAHHWAEAHGHSHKKVHAQPQHVLVEQQHIAGQGGHAAPGDLPHGGAPQAKLYQWYDKNLLPADMRDERQRAQHWAETHGHRHEKVHAQPQHVLEEQQNIAGQGGHAAPGDLPHGGAPQAKLYDKNLLPADMRDERQRARDWAETHGHSHKAAAEATAAMPGGADAPAHADSRPHMKRDGPGRESHHPRREAPSIFGLSPLAASPRSQAIHFARRIAPDGLGVEQQADGLQGRSPWRLCAGCSSPVKIDWDSCPRCNTERAAAGGSLKLGWSRCRKPDCASPVRCASHQRLGIERCLLQLRRLHAPVLKI